MEVVGRSACCCMPFPAAFALTHQSKEQMEQALAHAAAAHSVLCRRTTHLE